jgi:ferrous-iron efflux pump FieF
MNSQEYNLWVRRAGLLTIVFALTIVAIKLFAAIDTNAASILASLMDAMMDVAVSLLNFIALRYALKPADDEHRFGHGKAEAVMALFQAAFLAGAAFVLLYQGFNRFFVPAPVGAISNGIWAMLLCSGLTLTLVLLQRWIIAKTGSLAVHADQAHYRGDLLMNAAVLLALYLVQNSLLWADAVIAILIAGYLLFNAAQLLRESMVHLLDEELPETERLKILQHLQQMPGVLGVEQLRTRRAGPRVFVQLRLLLPQDWSLQKAHQVTDLAEQQIAALYADAEVIIHPDPSLHAVPATD